MEAVSYLSPLMDVIPNAEVEFSFLDSGRYRGSQHKGSLCSATFYNGAVFGTNKWSTVTRKREKQQELLFQGYSEANF